MLSTLPIKVIITGSYGVYLAWNRINFSTSNKMSTLFWTDAQKASEFTKRRVITVPWPTVNVLETNGDSISEAA